MDFFFVYLDILTIADHETTKNKFLMEEEIPSGTKKLATTNVT